MIKIVLSSFLTGAVGAYLLLSLFFGSCTTLNKHAANSLGVWKDSSKGIPSWQCVESSKPYKNKEC